MEILLKAYPSTISNEVSYVLDKLNLKSEHKPSSPFEVFIKGEKIEIPERIYFEPINLELASSFTPLQNEILNTLYSRHHDGYIRERCLKNIIHSKNIWVIPYIIRLLGEYVIEILRIIKKEIPEISSKNIKEFLIENSAFYEINKRRVTSYWSCYYRNEYRNQNQYVGFQIIEYLDNLLKNEKSL